MTNAVTPTTRPTVSATSVMSRNAAESPPAMAAWRDSRSADSSVRPRQRLRTASLDATVSRQPWRPQRHSCAADERSTVIWPISPASRWEPRSATCPPRTAPPAPVDRRRYTRLRSTPPAAAGGVDRSLVYLRLSTGAGGAVLGGHVALRGSHLLAGEIGHMTVDRSSAAQLCRCGRHGCLETVASKEAVLSRWRGLTDESADLESLQAAIAGGDSAALRLITEVAETVGRVVGVTALVMDPDQIVIAGEVGALLRRALPALREAVVQETLTGDELHIRIARTDSEQGARGAITALRATDDVPDLYRDFRIPTEGFFDPAGGTSVS